MSLYACTAAEPVARRNMWLKLIDFLVRVPTNEATLTTWTMLDEKAVLMALGLAMIMMMVMTVVVVRM